MLARSVVVTTRKGGNGKTSITANLAGLAAEAQYRVLVVDLDPQADLGRDLGYRHQEGVDDSGESLLKAIQFGEPVVPARNVRPGLDVVPGGDFLFDAAKLESNLAARGRNPRLVLEEALAPIADDYHLILVDTPPGDRYLRDIAMCAAQFIVIPTRSDEASLDGVTGVAHAFAEARTINPDVQLLGVVLFGIGSQSTVIQRQVRNAVSGALGDVAPVFQAQVRYLEAPAVESRARGMLVHEYERDLVSKAPTIWEQLRMEQALRDEGSDNKDLPATTRVARSAHKLAADYAALTAEVLSEMNTRVAALDQVAAQAGAR